MLERLETQTTGRNCVQLYVDSMTCGIVTYRICDTISNQHNVVRAQIKCHTEWLCDHGLSAEPVLLDYQRHVIDLSSLVTMRLCSFYCTVFLVRSLSRSAAVRSIA